MPINEKEYNGILFDRLSILERIESVTDDEKALKQIALERRQIERKLYQLPPLTGGQQPLSLFRQISYFQVFHSLP